MDLIISPHMDDEMLGCYSVLTRNGKMAGGGHVLVHYMTTGHANAALSQKMVDECHMVADKFNVKQSFSDLRPNHMEVTPALINQAEGIIYDSEGWNAVYLPHPDYNQDHRATYEIWRTALRVNDRSSGTVPRVFTYEQPCTQQTMHNDFTPQYFRRVNGLQKSMDFVNVYRSQTRGHRGENHIRNLAFMRGDMIGYPAAEAFEVLRWIE